MLSRSQTRVPSTVFRWFAFAAFLSMILIVASGAAVRLTGSGLGCPDWPTCFKHQLIGQLGIHSTIEYANRAITGILIVVTGLTFIASLLRSPRRSDLIWLSGGLVAGVVADALLGALVVYSKLNPWLVSLHLLLSLAMVVIGAVLYHRSKYLYGPGTRADVRDRHFLLVARLLWIPFFAVLVAGTMTTGSGPHSGSSQGQLSAKRLPFAFSSAAWVHSVLAMFFVAIIIGLLVAIWNGNTPKPLQLGVRRLAVIGLLQAAIGFSQYWLHVPAALVELHVIGAVSLTIGVTQFHLRQTAHDREPGIKSPAAPTPATVGAH